MARGHHVTGVDFAPAMIAEARRKAAERSVLVRFERVELHWFEAHGIGRVYFKRKRNLD